MLRSSSLKSSLRFCTISVGSKAGIGGCSLSAWDVGGLDSGERLCGSGGGYAGGKDG